MAGLLAEVPAFDDGVGALLQQVDGQRPAVEQEDNRWLAEVEDGP